MVAYKTFLKHTKTLIKNGLVDESVLDLKTSWWEFPDKSIHYSNDYCHYSNDYSYVSRQWTSGKPKRLSAALGGLEGRNVCTCLDYSGYGNYLEGRVAIYSNAQAVKVSQKGLELSSLIDLKLFEERLNQLLKAKPGKFTNSNLRNRIEELNSFDKHVEKSENSKIIKDSSKYDDWVESLRNGILKARQSALSLSVDPKIQQEKLEIARAKLVDGTIMNMEFDETPVLVAGYYLRFNRTNQAFLDAFKIFEDKPKHVSVMPRYAYEHLLRELGYGYKGSNNGLMMAVEATDIDQETLKLAAELWNPANGGSYTSIKNALAGAKTLMQ